MAQTISGGYIIQKMDEAMRFKSDISAKVVLTQKKVSQGTRVIEMRYFRRDQDDSFLISMIAPEVEKGNGYLKKDDHFWMYRRNTRSFQHISRDENIGGTDANADDFETKKLAELYTPVKLASGQDYSEETVAGIPVYKIELKAKTNDTKYPKRVYWVKKDTFLPVKEQNFSLSGTLMQTSYYIKYTSVQGKYVLTNGLFVDEFEKGNRTLLEISEISLAPIESKVFTKAHLENLSK